jgi:hypothetical protein
MMLNDIQTETELSFHRVLRWPTDRSKNWIYSFVSSAMNDSNIIAIIAIGSAVRPDVSSTDIDLLTICADLHSLNRTPPIEVDLRAYALAEIDSKLGKGHDLLTWGIMFGHSLFQRERFWDALVTSWRSRMPLPSSTLARQRAASVYRHLTEIIALGDEQAAREQAISYFTHLVRAELLEKGVYPASRPELAGQLLQLDESELASALDQLLRSESIELTEIGRLLEFSYQ